MNLIEQQIIIQKKILTLTNQKAIFWQQHQSLIISDLHLGKSAHFRKNGIAIPSNVAEKDVEQLQKLLNHYQVQQLIIVGDLIHAGTNTDVEMFSNLLLKFPQLKTILIKGNHDRLTTNQLKNLGILAVYDYFELDEILFSHDLSRQSGKLVISGHIHPGVNVKFNTKTMRFPCYVIGQNNIILPAFSSFTGLDTNINLQNANYYAFYEKGIFKANSV
ncbi:MAG: ligase-associated DNA damage response endonuclease PdeM [Chitinophagaceae bacterium]